MSTEYLQKRQRQETTTGRVSTTLTPEYDPEKEEDKQELALVHEWHAIHVDLFDKNRTVELHDEGN